MEIASRQEIQSMLDANLKAVAALLASKPAPDADELLTAEEVAALTKFDPRTVRVWAKQGKYNTQGHRIYLRIYDFGGGQRFKRSDVEAFGLGTGLLEPSHVAGQRLEATKKPPATKRKRSASLDSEAALKVA